MSISLDASIAHSLPGILPKALPQLSGNATFADAMKTAISSVEQSSSEANAMVGKFLSGDSSIDIHSVALAGQRAEVSLELFQQVRNKVVSAYQEIMRSQL